MSKLECKLCGRRYAMLADGICFFCDKKHWEAYFIKILGNKKR